MGKEQTGGYLVGRTFQTKRLLHTRDSKEADAPGMKKWGDHSGKKSREVMRVEMRADSAGTHRHCDMF